MVPEYKTIMWRSPKCENSGLLLPSRHSKPLWNQPIDERTTEVSYLMSFQKEAFKRQATTMKTDRNNITQTPMRTRVFCAGSAIHCR